MLDIQSAYDSTWRRLILDKLSNWKIGSHLFRYIVFILSNNSIQVKINSHFYSSSVNVSCGIRQGSSLSCALFNIALTDIATFLPVNIKFNLYIDDLIIYSSHKDPNALQISIQDALHSLSTWSNYSGFTFSADKSVSMMFHRLRHSHHPPVYLNNIEIKYKESHKWLGLIVDSKLNWIPQINYLNNKLKLSSNILKMLNNPSWGLNRSILLKIYNSYCRPITDYGSIVYQSAKPSAKGKLNSTHNNFIRLCTGAFRSSPLDSLFCESSIPNLQFRSNILMTNYISKLAANPNHMLHHSLIQSFNNPSPDFLNKPKPLFVRFKDSNLISFDVQNVIKLVSHKEQWLVQPISFDRLINVKKDNCSSLEIQSAFNQYISKFSDFCHCFVDGSKSMINTGCAFSVGDEYFSFSLNPICSVFTAELLAIFKCLQRISLITVGFPNKKFIVFSDSLSALKSLENPNPSSPLTLQILNTLDSLSSSNILIAFCWIPSHKGIKGNEIIDKLARETSSAQPLNLLNHIDIKHTLKNSLFKIWDSKWKELSPNNSKLREVKDTIFPWPSSNLKTHREEIVITRLRIGHSRLTHGYLMSKDDPPSCPFCLSELLTIKHLLITCTSNRLHSIRSKHNFGSSLSIALGDNTNNLTNVISFLKDIDLYKHI